MSDGVLDLVRRGVEAAAAVSRADVPSLGVVEGNTPPLQALGTLFRIQRIDVNLDDLALAPARLKRHGVNLPRPPAEVVSKAFALSQFAFARLAPLDAARLSVMVNACRDALLANGFPPQQLPLYLMDVLELVVRIFAEPACGYTLPDEADARDHRLGVLAYELVSLETPREPPLTLPPVYSVFVAARNLLMPGSGYLYRLVAERFEGDPRTVAEEARRIADILLDDRRLAAAVSDEAAAWKDPAIRAAVVDELLDADRWERKAYQVACRLAAQITRRGGGGGALKAVLGRMAGPAPLFSPTLALSLAPLQFPRLTPGVVTNLRTSAQFLQQLEAGDRREIGRLVETLSSRLPPGTTGSERPGLLSPEELDRLAGECLRTEFEGNAAGPGNRAAAEMQMLGNRPADPGAGVGRRKWGRFQVVQDADSDARLIRWYQKSDPAPLGEGGPDPAGPDISGMLIALDASGSMAGDKFRTAVVAAFGCIRGLLEVRRDLRWASLVFSNRTLYGGWHTSEDVDRVRAELTQFLGGGTHIDPAVLDRALAERPGPTAVLLITDGAVADAAAVSRRFRGFLDAEAGSRLLHLNIGQPNELTAANTAAGLRVQCIADERDLPGLALRFAADAGRPRRGQVR